MPRTRNRRSFLKIGSAAIASAAATNWLAHAEMPASVTIRNRFLAVTAQPADGTFSVQDLRTRRIWLQHPQEDWIDHPKTVVGPDFAIEHATSTGNQIELTGTYKPTGKPLTCTLALDAGQPELLVTITADGEMPYSLNFPHAFQGGKDLILPLNEGLRYPVDDPYPKNMLLEAYAGHGLCMPFWGLTGNTGDAMMAIIETRADMRLHINRSQNRSQDKEQDKQLFASPQWQDEKGMFSYPRKLRYVFFDKGGYVAICKRYRAHAQQAGLFKTLVEKKKERPAIDKLIGAVNVWCYDQDSAAVVKDMQAVGIDRILWSAAKPKDVAALNALGCVTSTYDLYSDIMDPANYPLLQNKPNGRWFPDAWPDQIILDKDGKPLPGWKVKGKDGGLIACGVSNDQFRPAWARKRIGDELASAPYNGRFMDTVGASRWMEDYSPAHPMTRSQCDAYRNDLLKVPAEAFHLVTGTETGIDTVVPYTDFLEGMTSLVNSRLPDEKYSKNEPWPADVPESFTKMQIGAAYRLPLWELVYHECIVSTAWWGDYNNVVPALWDRFDLFNILYGTMPMYRFEYKYFRENRDRFAASYKRIAPITRAAGYSEMTGHTSLTPDNLVQQTHFANGVTVTVNFSDQPYAVTAKKSIAPGAFATTGI